MTGETRPKTSKGEKGRHCSRFLSFPPNLRYIFDAGFCVLGFGFKGLGCSGFRRDRTGTGSGSGRANTSLACFFNFIELYIIIIKHCIIILCYYIIELLDVYYYICKNLPKMALKVCWKRSTFRKSWVFQVEIKLRYEKLWA